MSATFRSLSNPGFRAWFIGALVSNVGTWMQATAMNWVVLTEVTDGSATALGVVLALQFAPPLLLVAVTGWCADRFDRLAILPLTQSIAMLLAIAMGVLLLVGLMSLPLMYGFAAALGVVIAFDGPARQATVSDLVGGDVASNAIALNAASFSGARMIGPAIAGLLIAAVGSGWVFLVNGLTFVAMIGVIARLRRAGVVARAHTGSATGVADGLAYVRSRHDLIALIAMMAVIGAFGMNFAISASTMAVEFDRGAAGLGVLTSSVAVGALGGALIVARRPSARFPAIVAGAAMLAAAGALSVGAPAFWLYAATLVGTGFALEIVVTTAHGYVQTTAPQAIRGRVVALYMAIVIGATPIGAPVVGRAADALGARGAVALSAASAVVASVIGIAWMVLARQVRRDRGRRFGFTLVDGPELVAAHGTAATAATIVTDHDAADVRRSAKEPSWSQRR